MTFWKYTLKRLKKNPVSLAYLNLKIKFLWRLINDENDHLNPSASSAEIVKRLTRINTLHDTVFEAVKTRHELFNIQTIN